MVAARIEIYCCWITDERLESQRRAQRIIHKGDLLSVISRAILTELGLRPESEEASRHDGPTYLLRAFTKFTSSIRLIMPLLLVLIYATTRHV